jgi:hypothetical protein
MLTKQLEKGAVARQVCTLSKGQVANHLARRAI